VQWFEKVKLHFDKSMSVVLSDPVLRLRDGVIADHGTARKSMAEGRAGKAGKAGVWQKLTSSGVTRSLLVCRGETIAS
jgi:hypothetical protein